MVQRSGASTPHKHGRNLRPGKNMGTKIVHIFTKVGRRKINGEETLKLLKHIFVHIPVSQKFSRSIHSLD